MPTVPRYNNDFGSYLPMIPLCVLIVYLNCIRLLPIKQYKNLSIVLSKDLVGIAT